MNKVSLKARIVNLDAGGKLGVDFIDNDRFVNEMLKQFYFKEVLIDIKMFKSKRSLEQNAYYWGVMIPAIIAFLKDTQGEKHDPKTIHAYHLQEVADLKINIKMVLNVPVRVVEGKTTSEMTVKEMSEFIETIIEHWEELTGVINLIPEPTTKI